MLKWNFKLLLLAILFFGLVGCNSDEDIPRGPSDSETEVPVGPSTPSDKPSDKPSDTPTEKPSDKPSEDSPVEPSEPNFPSEPDSPTEPDLEDMTFYRPKTAASNANCDIVFEYMPAPGQFINETKTGGFDGTQTTLAAANEYAIGRINSNIWVSLGGFGGYIVLGFDHSILNTGGYDFAVKGNSFNNSSEPGIVYVMKDSNGDGLPNDTWYELEGCETLLSSTIRDYEVTYYRPTETGAPVKWTDNKGDSGEIDYLKAYHTQDYYYPLWVEEDSYTLKGTRLESKNYDQSGKGSYWVLPTYDWGYVDNFSAIDRVDSKSKDNRFMISNAIDENGNKVNLPYIDFIKVQTGVNSKSGWLGEVSTEILGAYDLN